MDKELIKKNNIKKEEIGDKTFYPITLLISASVLKGFDYLS